MSQGESAPDRSTIVAALWLAFSRSPVATTLGESGLRSVVEVQFSELVAAGHFDLQQVWELLEVQPEIELSACIPALCLFKTWEERLGLPVQLPHPLAQMSRGDIARRALEAGIAPAAASKLFRQAESRARRSSLAHSSGVRDAGSSEPGALAGGDDHKQARPRRRGLELAAGALAVFGFATAAAFAYQEWSRSPGWASLPTGFSGDIPVRDAARLGNQVGAVLADASWLKQPEDRRRQHMEAALGGLRSENVAVFFVTDADKQVLATARWDERRRAVDVHFPGIERGR